jgi:hypothetical protein
MKSLEFHNKRGDFEKWVVNSLRDKTLSERLKKVRLSRTNGEMLRKSLVKAANERLEKLSKELQESTRYF